MHNVYQTDKIRILFHELYTKKGYKIMKKSYLF